MLSSLIPSIVKQVSISLFVINKPRYQSFTQPSFFDFYPFYARRNEKPISIKH